MVGELVGLRGRSSNDSGARAPLCSGLARRPLKAVARVRIPSGLLLNTRSGDRLVTSTDGFELVVFFVLAFLLSWSVWPLMLLEPSSTPMVPLGLRSLLSSSPPSWLGGQA